MNEDRVIGAGREMLGKAERSVGGATGSDRLQGDGVVDQVAGSIQHGYGRVKDAVGDIIDDAPGAVAGAINRGRELSRQGDDALRDRLGDNGRLFLIGGVVALFALGAFALTRSTPATALKPAPKRRAAKPAKTAG